MEQYHMSRKSILHKMNTQQTHLTAYNQHFWHQKVLFIHHLALYSPLNGAALYDEAHTIKNRSTLVAQGCNRIDATRRWCVTGTPMQNGIQDLYSLIKFLNHQPWSVPLWWNRAIKKPFDDGDEKAKGTLTRRFGSNNFTSH